MRVWLAVGCKRAVILNVHTSYLWVINCYMEQLILNVKTKEKVSFLKELVKHLDFVEVVEPPKLTAKEKKILAALDKSVAEVGLHKKGKGKLKTIQEVLDGI